MNEQELRRIVLLVVAEFSPEETDFFDSIMADERESGRQSGASLGEPVAAGADAEAMVLTLVLVPIVSAITNVVAADLYAWLKSRLAARLKGTQWERDVDRIAEQVQREYESSVSVEAGEKGD